MFVINRYKKLLILSVIFIVAIFLSPFLDLFLKYLSDSFGIYSAIILGFFYSFSFTGGAAAVMLTGIKENYLLYSILAATGSMIADITILKIIRINLEDEINLLAHDIKKYFEPNFSLSLNKYVQLSLGILIIGSPLPDEIGVYILNNSRILNKWQFYIISFIANFTFIFLISRFL